MSNASFCPVCGEMISDGCEELDEFGNETGEINYSPCKCDQATNPVPVIETRDAAAKAIQDVIKERTCFGIGIGVIREALDTAFPEYVDVERTLGTRSANPAPVIETASGAVDMEPNPTPGPHHTARRIAELNDVVAALNESNNALLHNQGIHEAAITELQRRMDADIGWRNAEIARVHRSYQKLADAGQWDESLTELTGFTPADPPIPPQPTPPASELDYESSPDDNTEHARAIRWSITWECRCGRVSSVFSEARYVRAVCPECGSSWEISPSFCDSTPYVAEKGEVPHDPTPPTAPDEGADLVPIYVATRESLPASDVADIVAGWDIVGRAIHEESSIELVDADLVDMAKAAVAKAVELGLVSSRKNGGA